MKPWIPMAIACAAIAGGAQAAEMKVYKQPNFGGDSLTLTGELRDFANRRFHDQASSIVVNSGRWQVCSQPDFKGDCMILDRGEYSRLDEKLFHRVESARVVEDRRVSEESNIERPRDRAYAEGPRVPRWQRHGVSSIELYARPGFEGRAFRAEEDMETLARTGVDRRVFSVIVNDGSWQVCSQPHFGGYCRVLEPGQYEDLGRMSGQIGSVRRIG
jgi:hypothetical protein